MAKFFALLIMLFISFVAIAQDSESKYTKDQLKQMVSEGNPPSISEFKEVFKSDDSKHHLMCRMIMTQMINKVGIPDDVPKVVLEDHATEENLSVCEMGKRKEGELELVYEPVECKGSYTITFYDIKGVLQMSCQDNALTMAMATYN